MVNINRQTYRSGFVAVMGRPNVGKSTLVNALIGMKIAAVSPWPQTTRKKQMGILTLKEAQIIFVDTPGVHKPLHKLGERMNQEAAIVLDEGDLVLFVVDVSQSPNDDDRLLADLISKKKCSSPVILAFNKIDLSQSEIGLERLASFQSLLPTATTVKISATRGDNLETLIDQLIAYLPANPPFFPDDQITDLFERDIAADLIREAILLNLRAEVPHSIAVRIDEYKELPGDLTRISATLFTERESQKAIVIGQGGVTLKKIGIMARQNIEETIERKVYLNLRVKVKKNWRNDKAALSLFGFHEKTS